MYAHLTKKEKAKKLALARKRAILWSAQERRKKQLQASVPVVQPSSLVEPIFYPAYSELPNTPSVPQTIPALQATISDLLHQQEQLEITIRVLTGRLDTLLQQAQQENE